MNFKIFKLKVFTSNACRAHGGHCTFQSCRAVGNCQTVPARPWRCTKDGHDKLNNIYNWIKRESIFWFQKSSMQLFAVFHCCSSTCRISNAAKTQLERFFASEIPHGSIQSKVHFELQSWKPPLTVCELSWVDLKVKSESYLSNISTMPK